MRMILHRVTDDVGDLDETSVILLVQRPHDAPLHRLETVGEIRDRAVADDIAGVFEKAFVHTRVQTAARLFGIKRRMDDDLDRLGNHMIRAVAIGGGWRGCAGQFRLAGFFFAFG